MNEGVNNSEQFVYEVCQRSFLSLWSYVNPQGRASNKELCDILVVCDPHVIVISVKDIELKQTGNAKINFERWQRKAIEDSRKQISGAIRWLDTANGVITKEGAKGLPLPPKKRRIYHRIAIAFGSRREVPIISHSPKMDTFIHIFEEGSFYLLLRHLDTISDFIQYLDSKEKLLANTNVLIEGGEENLLAVYLHRGRKFPKNLNRFIIHGTLWKDFSSKKEVLAKLQKDEESYVWDRLIESFCCDSFDAATWRGPGLSESEQALRVLALENRFNRRILGSAFKEFLEESKARKIRARTVMSNSSIGYVFFAYDANSRLEERRSELVGRCFASLCIFPEVSTVIGININIPGDSPKFGFTTDLALLHADDANWSKDFWDKAHFFRDNMGYFKSPNEIMIREDEYPDLTKDNGPSL
ncbi:NERD domain-containing protein [Planctomycetota bacterium]